MSRRPRLALVTDAWSPQVNGVVTTLTKLAEMLPAAGIDVSVVEPSRFRTVPMPRYPGLRLTVSPFRALRALDALQPDYVHIATEGPLGSIARFWCRRRGYRFTTSYHTRFPEYVRDIYGLPSAPVTGFMRWFHGGAERTLVPTAGVRNDLEASGFRHLVVWTRGVDTTLFNPSANVVDWYGPNPDGQKTLLYVGRVSKEKGIDEFCRLAANPGYRCWVVGDGPQRKPLEARYGGQVNFVGFKHGLELARFYASADVMVFPSLTDTFGNVITESMASGTPVAAHPVTGPIDVLSDGVSGAMDESLPAAVERALACDRSLVRDYAMNFSWDTCARIFINSLAPNHQRG